MSASKSRTIVSHKPVPIVRATPRSSTRQRYCHVALVTKNRALVRDSFRNVFGAKRDRTRVPSRHEEALCLELVFVSQFLSAFVRNDYRKLKSLKNTLDETNAAFDGGTRANTLR